MKILVTGARGTLGRPLVCRLLAAGHAVTGLTRGAEGAAALRRAGAGAVIADLLDRPALELGLASLRPEAVVHLPSAFPAPGPRRSADFAATARLRGEGTTNLLHAAARAGVRRLVAESMVLAYGYGDHGERPLEEDDPVQLLAGEPARRRDVVAPLRSLERDVTEAGGIVLRLGMFRGPGAPSSAAMEEAIRRRQLPIVGDGKAWISRVDVHDAVDAVMRALDWGIPGRVYNIVDDRPLRWRELLELEARRLGAPPPRRVPAWLLRLLGPAAADFLTTSLPVSNARARRELGWTPGQLAS